jgi:predicted branched-subunit amino acid permease
MSVVQAPSAAVSPARTAVREILPIAASVSPFAVVIGVAMREADIGLLGGLVGSFAIYGGSAQLAAVTLLKVGAGMLAVVATAAVVNARFLVYAAALEPLFRDQPRWFRWSGPQLIVDQTYGLTAGRAELAEPAVFRRYWLAAGAVLSTVWLSSIAVGMTLGPVLPASAPLDFAAVAVLIALLAPHLRGRVPVTVAVVAAAVAAAGSQLPGGVGLLAGIGAGLGVAGLMDRRPR